MTTTARPSVGQPRGRTPRVLLVAGACVLVVVALLALVAGLTSGSSGALGALVGGGLSLAFLLFGSATVVAATSLAPQSSMLVAVMTFTLQVVLVAAVFLALDASDAVRENLSSEWLAAGVITAAVGWIVAQMVASAKSRILAYDIDLPQQAEHRPESEEVGAP